MKRVLYIVSICWLVAGAVAAELYVSVADGNDTTGTGSFEQPYKTIAKAMAEITPGDACIIREGVYREAIVPQVDDIYIGPFEEDDVEINGCDVVTNSWSDYEGEIKTLPAPEQVWQVFVGGKRMKLARFPDMGEESTLLSTDKNNYLSAEIIMPPTPDRSIVEFPATADYPDDFFKGAVYTGRHGKNSYTACAGTIKGSTNGVLEVFAYGHRQWNRRNTTRFGSGHGYIINCLNVLDAVEEWYWSPDDELLYFYPPAEVAASNAVVEVRHRLWGLDLRNRTGVVVEGLRFQAASIRLDDAVSCEVNHCEILYMAPWSPLGETDYGGRLAASCGVYVSGQTNRLWRNHIAHSWGGGVRMEGSDNILEQCLVEDIGWIGRRTSGVQLWGERNHALRNVIQKVGNSGFDGGQRGFGIGRFGRELDVRYNLVQNFGYLSSHDVGAYYVNTQGYPAPVKQMISSNTFFYYKGPGAALAPGAVYSDNGTHGLIAENNYSRLSWRKRNPVDVIFRNNSTTYIEGNPELSDEGIEALLTDTNSCPPVDAGALFDEVVPNPGGDPETATNMTWVILDDRIDYTEAELREIFPAPDMDVWLAEVNYAPVPASQSLSTEVDTPVAITLTATDDQFGDDPVFTVTAGPTRGTLSGEAPNLIYTPYTGFKGYDSFRFSADDGISSASATVSIGVSPEDLITIEYSFETPGHISGTNSSIVYTAPDVNTFAAGIAASELELSDSESPSNYYGRIEMVGSDSVAAVVADRAAPSTIEFTLDISSTKPVTFSGITFDTFYFSSATGNTLFDWTFETITEGATNHTTTGGFTHNGGSAYQRPASAAGDVYLVGLTNLTDTSVTFRWTLDGDKNHTFDVRRMGIDDIVLTVGVENELPIAHSNSVATLKNTPVAITLAGSDSDGDILDYEVVMEPASGLLSGEAPNLIYTPDARFTGSDSFTFAVNDGVADSAEATVAITIEPVNDGSGYIEYTFETPGHISGATNNLVYTAPDRNTFAGGVTVSSVELSDSSEYGRFVDLGGGSVEAAVNDRDGNTVSFTVTIDDTVSVDLTDIVFDTSFRFTLTDESSVGWDFHTVHDGSTNNAVSSAGWTHDGVDDYQSPGGAASGDIALTALTGLTDTSVTFVWNLDSSRNNLFSRAAMGLDDIVLFGSLRPLTVNDFGSVMVSGGTEMALSWAAVSGASYGVMATTNLVDGPWIEMTNGISGNDELISVTNSISEEQQYFRVYIEE